MNDDDEIFWSRIEEMPWWEAEQELVMRREGNLLEANMLMSERDKLLASGKKAEAREVMTAYQGRIAQNTKINERIGYLRKVQNRVQWKEAVRALYGQEAYEACIVWLEQQYGDMESQRREWKG